MKIASLFGAALILASASLAFADGGIGIHFVGAKPDSSTLAPTDTAGLPAVEQSHWNNVSVDNSDANGKGNSGALNTIVDSNGATISGGTVSVAPAADGQLWSTDAASWGFSGANLTLESGRVWTKPAITITGIPYAKYDVYVYAAAGDNGGQGGVTIAAAANAKGDVAADNTYFYNFNWQDGSFVKSDSKTLDDAKASKGSNYVVFSGNTASAITITADCMAAGGWTGISGVQIVEVK